MSKRLFAGIQFSPPRPAELDCLLEVRIRGVVVGHIRQHPETFAYCYYRVPKTTLVPFHEAAELEQLLDRVGRDP